MSQDNEDVSVKEEVQAFKLASLVGSDKILSDFLVLVGLLLSVSLSDTVGVSSNVVLDNGVFGGVGVKDLVEAEDGVDCCGVAFSFNHVY